MAHSFVQAFDDELGAFAAFAEIIELFSGCGYCAATLPLWRQS
jgi:hypothetical protein